jgi:hypothetical protein
MTIQNVNVSKIQKVINVAISEKNQTGVLNTSVPVTLKNMPVFSSGASTVDQLKDVNLVNRSDGSTLVYDPNTDTYIVKRLNFEYIVGDLDGGVF